MDKTLVLLQICDFANQWPELKALHDVAMDDLLVLNADAAKEMKKRLDDRAKVAFKAKADAEAKASEVKVRPKPAPVKEPLIVRNADGTETPVGEYDPLTGESAPEVERRV